jgi:hypothetical protein
MQKPRHGPVRLEPVRLSRSHPEPGSDFYLIRLAVDDLFRGNPTLQHEMASSVIEGADARTGAPAAPLRVRDAAAIIGRALQDPSGPTSVPGGFDAAALIAAASRHRVFLLLGWKLRAAGTLKDWPPEFIEAFRRAERAAASADCVRHSEVVRALADLASAGVRALPFKGAALAHTHYPAPHLRLRTDTDLLVAPQDVRIAEDALGRLGYVRPPEASGRLVSYQSHHLKTDRRGLLHAVDVHWKVSNVQSLADCFAFDELWERRVPVPSLGASAFTVGDAHALLLALVHRAGHHPGSREMLWIYDLHLLADRLTAVEMLRVEELAGSRGLSQIAADGLALARDWFGTAAADQAVGRLRHRAAHQENAAVIRGRWNQADLLRLELGALGTWRARGRLVREHLFPPASYMRARYGLRSNLLVPALYVWRALRGAPRWFRRREEED